MIKVPVKYYLATDGVLVVRYSDGSVRALYAYNKTESGEGGSPK